MLPHWWHVNRLEFMTVRPLTTSMGILLLAMVSSFQANAKNWNQDGKVTDYGSWGIPYNAQPNYATLKHHLRRYLRDHIGFDRYEALP